MHHRLLAVLVFANVLTAVTAQGPDFRAWLHSQFPDPQRVAPTVVVAAANHAGLLHSAADLLACKQAFYELRGKAPHAQPHHLRPLFAAPGTLSPAIQDTVVLEHEFNDSWKWADSFGASTQASGDTTLAYDLDAYALHASGANYFTFAVVAAGAHPVVDSTLTIRNALGDPVAFDDEPGLEALDLYLPQGDYTVEVGSWIDAAGSGPVNGGGYDLVVTTTALNTGAVRPLNPGGAATGTTRPPSVANHDVFRLFVPSDGRVAFTVNSNGGDTVLRLQRPDGTICFANDDSSTGGLDCGLDVDLPAGTYFVDVGDFFRVGGLAFAVNYNQTAGAFPDLTTTVQLTGSLLGSESLRLYRLPLSSDQAFQLATGPGPQSPVGDTVLGVYDRRLNYLFDDDDAAGLYSALSASLARANYFVVVTPYPGAAGDFTLHSACGLPFTPAGACSMGSNVLAVNGAGVVHSYTLANSTETSLRTRCAPGEFFYNLIGPDGTLAGLLPGQDWYAMATELPGGRNLVVAFDRHANSNSIHLELAPALGCENGFVTSHAKAGDLTFVFADFALAGSPLNLGFGDRGLFCLPLGSPTLMTLGVQLAGANGTQMWLPCPPQPFGVFLQAADFHTGANWTPGPLGTWRNVLSL